MPSPGSRPQLPGGREPIAITPLDHDIIGNMFLRAPTMHPHPSPLLTLYYDGGCPVCTREIGFYQRRRGAERIRWINLAQCDDSELGDDLTREAAYARLHARCPNGQLVSGAAAFAALWQSLPAFKLAGHIAAMPGVAQLLEWGYRGFLNVRRLWSKEAAACPVPQRPTDD